MSNKIQPVGPDDVDAITIELLKARRQHAALAALVVLTPSGQPLQIQALQALAETAEQADGFAWWWRVVLRESNPQVWLHSVDSLPRPLAVPASSEAEVEEFLLAGPTSVSPQQVSADDQLRRVVFERLANDAAVARRVALAAASDSETVPRAMMPKAFVVLGASDDPKLRRHVVDAATSTTQVDLALLQSLSAPWSDEEGEAVAEALVPLLRSSGNERLERSLGSS